jgi:hypothetical protein
MPFNKLNHSVLGQIRPRFALKIAAEPEKALKHLAAGIPLDPTVEGVLSNSYVFLKLPQSEQHYWSPELSVRIEIAEYTDYTTVACLVGPKQTVWTLWAFIYSSILLITVFSIIFGFAQYNVQGSSIWLWVIPFGILGLASAFVASKFGQRKGRDQMLHLISFVYHRLAELGPVERLERR